MTKKENPKRFGLLGKNIGYSFSRNYFSTKFSNQNLANYSYVNFDLPFLEGFEEILNNKPHLCGLNVTIPYKKKVIPFLDHISEESKAIGAVNTIVWDKEGKTVGHNTDHIGFKKALTEKIKSIPKRALILGTGGASNAVQYALKSLDCEATLVSRTAKRNQLTYDKLDNKVITNTQLIINTTPLGTFPNINEAPSIPYELLNPNHFLFDLIYNPSETLFMKKAKDQGSQTINGYQMLVYQAEKSWELWNE